MEMGEVIERDLGTSGVEHEPPCVAKDSCSADIGTNNEVPEEKPSTDEGFVTATRRTLHDIVVWWIER